MLKIPLDQGVFLEYNIVMREKTEEGLFVDAQIAVQVCIITLAVAGLLVLPVVIIQETVRRAVSVVESF